MVIQLATRFGDRLRELLGPERIVEVNRLNARRPHESVCHSHDFCDANVEMDAAFTEVVGRPYNQNSDVDAWLWSTAWDLAISMRFGT